MTYPLPGETVVRTLRNVEFGHGRPRDEPAPPLLADLFRAVEDARLVMENEYRDWGLERSHAAHEAYIRALGAWERRYNDLLRAMGRHRDKCYVCDGYRFWLHTEPDGCRKNSVRIEDI
jgi:hypothetical protein